jgi:hypothetical protein
LAGSPNDLGTLLVMDSSMPQSARIVLFCLIGILLVILGFLVAFAFLIRRRPAAGGQSETRPAERSAGRVESNGPVLWTEGAAAIGSFEGVAVAERDSLSCPTCRREYDGGLVYCPNDARRLIPASEMLTRPRGVGALCPRCRRAFDPGVRFCPHDAAELQPVNPFESALANGAAPPAGVDAKICPQCRQRYDLTATFCGKDGSELSTLN